MVSRHGYLSNLTHLQILSTVTDVKTGGSHSWLNQDFCNAFAKTAICHRDAAWCSVPSASLYCLLMAENLPLVQAAGPVWCHGFCPSSAQTVGRSPWSLANNNAHQSLSSWESGNHTVVWVQSSPKDHQLPAPLSQAGTSSIILETRVLQPPSNTA